MGAGFFLFGKSAKEKRLAPRAGEVAKLRLKKLLDSEKKDKETRAEPGRGGRRGCKETLTQGRKHDKTIQIKRL